MSRSLDTNQSSGFTLIEIMIVLAILGGIIAVGLPRLVRPNEQNLMSTLRHITVLSKEVRNKARLNKATYRIAFRMSKEEGHAYWVERASGKVLIDPEAEEARLREDENDRPPSPFQFDDSLMKEIKPFPPRFFFASIETATREDASEAGTGYIHYFPEGLVEESAIHITNGKNMNWTLAIHPLTGKVNVIKDNVSLEEIRRQ